MELASKDLKSDPHQEIFVSGYHVSILKNSLKPIREGGIFFCDRIEE